MEELEVVIVTADNMLEISLKSGMSIAELAWSWDRAESKDAVLFVAYHKLARKEGQNWRAMKLVLPKSIGLRDDVLEHVKSSELAWIDQ